MDRQAHWEKIYQSKGLQELSWTQSTCARSLEFIRRTGVSPDAALIDVGGGASVLVDQLLDLSFSNLSVLDLSGAALSIARSRLGDRAGQVTWLEQDITRASLPRKYAVWHDRAVFHFLTDESDRKAYAATLAGALEPGGFLILSSFAPDGPTRCSGLDIRRYDCEDVRRELGGSLTLVDRAREDHATPFGTIQKFSYCFFRNG
jgi:SAM-dependent methyltransferase